MSDKKKCPLCKLPCEELLLLIRNVFALAATVLFAITLLGGPHHLRGIAYFCGAAAYLTEILTLTDCFKKRVSLMELFMAILFCPMYVLLAFDYLKVITKKSRGIQSSFSDSHADDPSRFVRFCFDVF